LAFISEVITFKYSSLCFFLKYFCLETSIIQSSICFSKQA
jgi:hypothetical protein